MKGALREHWRMACATVGIAEVKRRGPTGWRSFSGVSIHDLRRSAIRNMRRAGIAESVAMTISGHQSPLARGVLAEGEFVPRLSHHSGVRAASPALVKLRHRPR